MNMLEPNYQEWGLFDPRPESKNATRVKLRGVADALNNEFYHSVQEYPEWNQLPPQRIRYILNRYAEFGAADSEGINCAVELLQEYYGITERPRAWRYGE